MIRTIYPLLFLTTAPLIAFAQGADSSAVDEFSEASDTFAFNNTVKEKKHFFRAAGELMLDQIIPWSYNYYVRDAAFARISFESIGNNLKLSSWEWDDNNFKTNQFAHPFHGNLYFNAFRTNGYSFWESFAAPFAGSLMWEIAGETNKPAPNDFINTSLGGVALGEMTYRIAGLIVNEKKRGTGRHVQEAIATLINPTNGFNRALDGKWGHRQFSDPEDNLHVNLTADAGVRMVAGAQGKLLNNPRFEAYGNVDFYYGDPFSDYENAFDNFNVYAEVGQGDSATLNAVRVEGAIWGLPIVEESTQDHLLRFTMNYDYYHYTRIEYGGQSANLSWASHYVFGNKWHLYTNIGGGPVILGATPNRYLYYGEGRNYDYGPGISYLGHIAANYKGKLFVSLRYRGGWTATVNGTGSYYWLQSFTSEIKYVIFKNFTISGSYGNSRLNSYYNDARYPDFKSVFPYMRLSAGYKLII